MQYIFMDLEFNNTFKERVLNQEIIEIGAVKVDENFKVIDKYTSFVCPVQNKHLTKYIKRLTGIEQYEIDNARRFSEVFEEFKNWSLLDNTEIIILSWSKSDIFQIRAESEIYDVSCLWFNKRYVDLQRVYGFMNNSKNLQVALSNALIESGVNFSPEKTHRALQDSELMLKLVLTDVSKYSVFISNSLFHEKIRKIDVDTHDNKKVKVILGEYRVFLWENEGEVFQIGCPLLPHKIKHFENNSNGKNLAREFINGFKTATLFFEEIINRFLEEG